MEIIRYEASVVKKKLKDLSSLMQTLENDIEYITKAKEEVIFMFYLSSSPSTI